VKIAMYSGSFDPVTAGHVHLIEKGAALFDKLIVAVMRNSAKTPMFSIDERLRFLQLATSHVPNAEVFSFDGLQAAFAKEVGATHLMRGLRSADDFSMEYTIALVNKSQNPGLETVFLTPDAQYSHICSAAVRDLISYSGDVSGFVPKEIISEINRVK